ncbi:MAG: hypothetical protein EPN40_02445 [Rhodanobacteraceae bacterium]|nr:MAG: hypothetical protein EPN40_02445 [Rhodanobacteraceae bacterium]
MKRTFIAVVLLAALLAGSLALDGCVVEARRPPPPEPACVWVRGHWSGPGGNVWIRAHWRCP